MDGNFTIQKNSCKRIIIEFKASDSLNFWPSIENLGFDDESYVMWCGFFVHKVRNYRCK